MKKKHQKLYILTKTVHLVKKLTKSNDFLRRRGISDFYISLRDLKIREIGNSRIKRLNNSSKLSVPTKVTKNSSQIRKFANKETFE